MLLAYIVPLLFFEGIVTGKTSTQYGEALLMDGATRRVHSGKLFHEIEYGDYAYLACQMKCFVLRVDRREK